MEEITPMSNDIMHLPLKGGRKEITPNQGLPDSTKPSMSPIAKLRRE